MNTSHTPMIRYDVPKYGSGCGITWLGIAGSMCVYVSGGLTMYRMCMCMCTTYMVYAYTYCARGCRLWHGWKQNHICMLL